MALPTGGVRCERGLLRFMIEEERSARRSGDETGEELSTSGGCQSINSDGAVWGCEFSRISDRAGFFESHTGLKLRERVYPSRVAIQGTSDGDDRRGTRVSAGHPRDSQAAPRRAAVARNFQLHCRCRATRMDDSLNPGAGGRTAN